MVKALLLPLETSLGKFIELCSLWVYYVRGSLVSVLREALESSKKKLESRVSNSRLRFGKYFQRCLNSLQLPFCKLLSIKACAYRNETIRLPVTKLGDVKEPLQNKIHRSEKTKCNRYGEGI